MLFRQLKLLRYFDPSREELQQFGLSYHGFFASLRSFLSSTGIMKFPTIALSALAAITNIAFALSPAEWRSQSVYQVLTDRFARTDGSTTAPCNTKDGLYCGGTWRGIINKLDYIQNMGFTAVSSRMTTPVTDAVTDADQ